MPFGQRQDLVDDLLGDLRRDGFRPQFGQCGCADARVQQPQVVVDLGHGADGGARIAARRLLVDGDRGRQALDVVDVGFLHLPEELARVRRQRFDVAALAFGVDRVERERALARAGEPGDHDELIARQREIDVLEVVLARALDDDRFEAVARRHRRERSGVWIVRTAVRARTHGSAGFDKTGAVDL